MSTRGRSTIDPPRDIDARTARARPAVRAASLHRRQRTVRARGRGRHPRTRRAASIAWHFFWDDDIDFPDDNDPDRSRSDVGAVQRGWPRARGDPDLLPRAHSRGRRRRAGGRETSRDAAERRRAMGQARNDAPDAALARSMPRENDQRPWRRLSTEGARQKAHPVARRLGWPERFTGSEAAFLRSRVSSIRCRCSRSRR